MNVSLSLPELLIRFNHDALEVGESYFCNDNRRYIRDWLSKMGVGRVVNGPSVLYWCKLDAPRVPLDCDLWVPPDFARDSTLIDVQAFDVNGLARAADGKRGRFLVCYLIDAMFVSIPSVAKVAQKRIWADVGDVARGWSRRLWTGRVAWRLHGKGLLHRVLREKGAVIDSEGHAALGGLPAPERSRDWEKTAA